MRPDQLRGRFQHDQFTSSEVVQNGRLTDATVGGLKKKDSKMTLATDAVFSKMLDVSQARPITDDDIDDRQLIPYYFVGGPVDGDYMLDSESWTKTCHEAGGRSFDRTNPRRHGPGAIASCGDDSDVMALHLYATDYDACRYVYVGIDSFLFTG